MPDVKLIQRDAKLVQWLNEAHAKEAELEAALTAHIALTEKQSYKKRLRQHLTETRDHKRRVASRIKALGGQAVAGPNLPGVPGAVGEVAGKAVAAVKTQVGTARAVVNNEVETQLRNAQEELREEHVEIAIYSRIIALAEGVGDRDTAQLAKAIRRDEERMAKYLDAELIRLVKDVVKQIPRDQRPGGGTRRTARRRTSTARKTSARSTTSRASSARKTTAGRKTSASRSRSGASSSRARSTSSRSTRSGTGRSSGTRSGTSRARSTGSRSSGARSRARASS